MGIRPFIRRLREDEGGAYAVEFAIVIPVFLILAFGALDLGHTLYTKAVLEGALQKAARDSALEGAVDASRRDAIDTLLKANVKQIQPLAEVTVTRRTFKDFSTAKTARKESYIETNGNSVCNNGEIYVDSNGSGSWDTDSGTDGQGGAKDVTIYTATMTYKRLFPTNTLLGFDPNVTMSAKTVLANQPYSDQIAPPKRTCP